MKITIYDPFFKIEMSGEFTSEEEAREFYAEELGTLPEEIEIVKIEQ